MFASDDWCELMRIHSFFLVEQSKDRKKSKQSPVLDSKLLFILTNLIPVLADLLFAVGLAVRFTLSVQNHALAIC